MGEGHCCDDMTRHVDLTCSIHEPQDCPDSVIAWWPETNRYGIRIHDGGGSVYVIAYCPWCGRSLPA